MTKQQLRAENLKKRALIENKAAFDKAICQTLFAAPHFREFMRQEMSRTFPTNR